MVPPTGLWINAGRAAALGIKNGDWTWVESTITGAKTKVRAKVTELIHPDAVSHYTGFGRKSLLVDPSSRVHEGINPSEFIPHNYEPWTGGAAKFETPVRVSKVPG